MNPGQRWTWGRVRGAIARRRVRLAKYLGQRARRPRAGEKKPFFVVGCQRSGTSITMDVFSLSPDTWVYTEGDRPAFDRDFRLTDAETVRRCIDRSWVAPVGFKPICDSHLVDRWLEWIPGSRAIWMYRHPADVTNSAVRMWGDHQLEIIRRIAAGDWAWLGWRGERLPEERIEQMRELARRDLSPHEGASLFWCLRNSFFFDLSLRERPDVMLVRYEDLVQEPRTRFARMFEFVGSPFDPSIVEGVSSASIRKAPRPPVATDIRDLCEDLLERLDAVYAEQTSGEAGATGSAPHAR